MRCAGARYLLNDFFNNDEAMRQLCTCTTDVLYFSNDANTANSPLSTDKLTLKTLSRQKSERNCLPMKFSLVSEYRIRFSIAIAVLSL